MPIEVLYRIEHSKLNLQSFRGEVSEPKKWSILYRRSLGMGPSLNSLGATFAPPPIAWQASAAVVAAGVFVPHFDEVRCFKIEGPSDVVLCLDVVPFVDRRSRCCDLPGRDVTRHGASKASPITLVARQIGVCLSAADILSTRSVNEKEGSHDQAIEFFRCKNEDIFLFPGYSRIRVRIDAFVNSPSPLSPPAPRRTHDDIALARTEGEHSPNAVSTFARLPTAPPAPAPSPPAAATNEPDD
jgi:hypothetical protein